MYMAANDGTERTGYKSIPRASGAQASFNSQPSPAGGSASTLAPRGAAQAVGKNKDEEDDEASSSAEEYVAEEVETSVGLSGTPYDAVVLAFTCLFDKQHSASRGKGASLALCIAALVMLTINVSVQFILVFSLLVGPVKSESSEYSDHDYINQCGAVVETALSSNVAIPTGGNSTAIDAAALQHCETLKTLPYTHVIVLFLWFVKMMQEFVDAIWRFIYVFSLPAVDFKKKDLLKIKAEGDKHTIIATTQFIKGIFVCACAIPQLIVAFLLTYTGAKYLYYATDMGKLVMKAISLSFITQVDELLFACFASQRFKELQKGASYKHTYSKNYHLQLWGTSAIKVGIAILVSVCFWMWLHTPLTTLRQACYKYKAEFPDATYDPPWDSFWYQVSHP